jgi:monovalent cation/hydrogen antiporter
VLQGLSLPRLLRWLNFSADGAEHAEEQRVRESITGVALHYLASTQKGDEIHGRAIKQLLDTYRNRAERSEIGSEAGADHPEARYMNELVSLERELIGIQRKALIDLRDRGTISDAVQRRFQVLLDLEESRLEEEERRWNL